MVLRATDDSWVQVRGPDGLLMTRLMRRGDAYRVQPDATGLMLMTGNAGGLLIELDGAILPPLGRSGEVRRDIPLDANRLRATLGGG